MVDIDEPTSGTSTPPAPVLPKPSARSKWQDEDKEESEEVGLHFSQPSSSTRCPLFVRGQV